MDNFENGIRTVYKNNLEKDNYNPHILCVNIGPKSFSAWAKNFVPKDELKEVENCLLYPIAIERKVDMSFDIIFGCLK